MNHPIVKNTFLFVVLVLLQVLIFNNVAYWGYVNPMIYIVYRKKTQDGADYYLSLTGDSCSVKTARADETLTRQASGYRLLRTLYRGSYRTGERQFCARYQQGIS